MVDPKDQPMMTTLAHGPGDWSATKYREQQLVAAYELGVSREKAIALERLWNEAPEDPG